MEPEPPKTIGVFFHGGPSGSGKTTTPNSSNSGQFYTHTENTVQQQGGTFVGRMIAPGLTTTSGVENGIDFITSNYQQGDQVILYGYSYGVDHTMDLATKLGEAGISVDLVVTVDGEDGLGGITMNTTVPDNVGENLNVYQRNGDGGSGGTTSSLGNSSSDSSSGTSRSSGTSGSAGSGGTTNTGSGSTVVRNVDVSGPGVNHGNIQSKASSTINTTITDHVERHYQ
ncbi:hypothetical protein [Lewinella sp. 4G2]|uniref:hypothetical protein n=1 Tax=Lewinella sp. 4G2 TaxID=1803372 RepID=UPI000AD82092|nr:hypothetical protein [Lewinella sp. 4G2]